MGKAIWVEDARFLLGQFETAAVPLMGQSAFGHLGAYSHELIFADVLSSRPAQFSGQAEQSSKAITVTVCEIVEDARRFVGKRVRFFAKFQSDGIEHSVLTDPDCGRGIEHFVPDEVEPHSDIQALDRALDKGMRGAIDKRIVATYERNCLPFHATGRTHHNARVVDHCVTQIVRTNILTSAI